MKYLNRIPAIAVVICFVVLILAGTYLLFPQGQKSEFFYLILMTIVISGADDQMVKSIFKKIANRRKSKDPFG